MSDAASFMSLATIHERLEACFLIHQERLLFGNLQGACALFRDYRDLLLLHIAHEDEILMPVFARIGQLKRWPPELYRGEHQKLKGWLTRIERGLIHLTDMDQVSGRDLIAQIDLEGGLKRLLEHHDERERQNFFPVLDQVTQDEERASLLARCLGEWDRLHQTSGFWEADA